MGAGSGDDLDRETEDLLSMLGPAEGAAKPEAKPEAKPAGAAPPRQQDRGLTALLDGLDDPAPQAPALPAPITERALAGKAAGKQRVGSTDKETAPLRPPTNVGPAPPPAAWPLETQSDARPPSMPEPEPPEPPAAEPAASAAPKRPKTDSNMYPRVDSKPTAEPSFAKPLDPSIKRPVSPAFEPAFTPPPERLASDDPVAAALVTREEPVEPELPEPADNPDDAAAAVDLEPVAVDPLAALRAAEARKPRTLLWVAIISFVAAGLAAVVYTQADAFHPERNKTREMVASDEKQRALKEHQRSQPVEGSFVINASANGESEAEVAVWLKLGRTPLESLKVPSSQVHLVRYELDRHKPLDEVIARPHWIGDGGEQRAQQGVQLARGSSKAPAFPPTEAVRPAPGPQGKGPMVLTSKPAGAEVWLLIGFTPDVKFTGARVGRNYEIKALKDGYRPSFAAVTASDWMMDEREVTVNVKLSPLVADKRRRR